MITVQTIASMIDHAVLHPTDGTKALKKACKIAVENKVATICVKGIHTAAAAELVTGSQTLVCTVVGFPHGNSPTKVKLLETEVALINGAKEIDLVIDQAALKDHNWNAIENELKDINKLCLDHNAILKYIIETDFNKQEEDIKALCQIGINSGAAFIKSSTGFGYVKNEKGFYNYKGAEAELIAWMLEYAEGKMEVKASGGIRNLDDLLAFQQMGVKRIGCSATITILNEAKTRFVQ